MGLCDSASEYSSSLFLKRASDFVSSGGSVVHSGQNWRVKSVVWELKKDDG
jgi:hypothetical protein